MAKVNFFYAQYVTQFMTIDEDNNGLYCQVPSESNGESYRVQCVEHKDHVEVESCNCLGFKYRKTCKHQTIIQNWWNKKYSSNIVKAQQKALEQAMDEEEARMEAEEMIAIAEQIIIPTKESQTPLQVETAQQAPEVSGVKKCKRLDYRSAYTASFFANLPSRKPAA